MGESADDELPFPLRVLFLIVKGIGACYSNVFAEQIEPGFLSFVGTLVSMTFSVGLCEELVKLLPALCVAFAVRDTPSRRLLVIGAAGGLGFGIAEGLHYAFTMYRPLEAPLSIYLFRFSGLPLFHAALTLIPTALVVMYRDSLTGAYDKAFAGSATRPEDFRAFLMIVVLLCMSSAIPHALYNSFAFHDVGFMAFLCSVAVAAIATTMLFAAIPESAPMEQRSADA